MRALEEKCIVFCAAVAELLYVYVSHVVRVNKVFIVEGCVQKGFFFLLRYSDNKRYIS